MCKQTASQLHIGCFQCPGDPFPSINIASRVTYHQVLDQSRYRGQGAAPGASLAHGHQHSTSCWEHTHFGQIFPATVTTCLPKHKTPWKFPPLQFYALLFGKDEVINSCKLIRLLLEQLAAWRTWQKAWYSLQKVCILRFHPRSHFDTVASNFCGLTSQAGIFKRLGQAHDAKMKPGAWGRAPWRKQRFWVFNPSDETGFRHSKVRQKRQGLIQQKVVIGERSKLVSIALTVILPVLNLWQN